jgi:hypothetical protein
MRALVVALLLAVVGCSRSEASPADTRGGLHAACAANVDCAGALLCQQGVCEPPGAVSKAPAPAAVVPPPAATPTAPKPVAAPPPIVGTPGMVGHPIGQGMGGPQAGDSCDPAGPTCPGGYTCARFNVRTAKTCLPLGPDTCDRPTVRGGHYCSLPARCCHERDVLCTSGTCPGLACTNFQNCAD